MKQFVEVVAVRIGALLQDICADVDFEVASLPGGSLVAVLLCLYVIAFGTIRRAAAQNRTLMAAAS